MHAFWMNTDGMDLLGQDPQFDSHTNHTVSDTRDYMESVRVCVRTHTHMCKAKNHFDFSSDCPDFHISAENKGKKGI